MHFNILSYLKNLLGDEFSQFERAEKEAPAIRVNTLKAKIENIKQEMANYGVDFAPHSICPEGFILKKNDRPLSQTLLYFSGEIFYQGFSSQLPVIALDPRPGDKVLDIAAAPGSKSTQIAARMENEGTLVLNDASCNRQQPLLANLYRAGVYNDIVLNLPGQRIGKIYPGYFDKVLVDAPCSGISRMPTSKKFLDRPCPESLKKLTNIQHHLLVSAIKATKPGGTIVYSTCSIIPEENEHIIETALNNYPVKLENINSWRHPNLRAPFSSHSQIAQNCKRVLSYPNPCESFFIAKLFKTDSTKNYQDQNSMVWTKTLGHDSPNVSSTLNWISNRWNIPPNFFENYNFIQTSKKLWILSPQTKIVPATGFVKSGIPFAENRGREWKLTNASIQVFGDFVDSQTIELDDTVLIRLFEKGKIPFQSKLYGYFILQRKNKKLGIVSIVDNNLKIHLPHFFDLKL
jgi:NOL1/NOP2/sun family putative RNA methylase